jgi:hypothetical protein
VGAKFLFFKSVSSRYSWLFRLLGSVDGYFKARGNSRRTTKQNVRG